MEIRQVSRLEIEAPASYNGFKEPKLTIVADDGSILASIALRELAAAIAPYLAIKTKDDE